MAATPRILHTAASMPPGRRKDANLSPAPALELAIPDRAAGETPGSQSNPALGPQALLSAEFRKIVRDAIARFLAFRARGQSHLVDDLTHEVFVMLLRDDARKLRTFTGRHGCSFASWLKVVAVRLAIDRLRRERRLVYLDADTGPMHELRCALRSDTGDPEASVQGAEAAERLVRALAQLSSKDRLLAELHLVRGRSLENVAEIMGVTLNAAYVRKSRLLERLRRLLGASA